MKLTTEQKNIFIAEKMGFKRYNPVGLRTGGNRDWIPPNKNGYLLQQFYANCGQLPDFFTDLNACHEAEVLTSGGYADILRIVVARDAGVHVPHLCDDYLVKATAAQRAEALGLTLKLWEADDDSKPAPFYGACGWE